jgi:hypothetical protein
VTQALDPAQLTWERGPIKRDRFGFPEPMRRAWWRFDFSGVIPDDAMASTKFMVGVRWPRPGRPYVGGSEFNRDCKPNWSDYADGEGWVPNLSDGSCNWPMFRVAAQTITTQMGECR